MKILLLFLFILPLSLIAQDKSEIPEQSTKIIVSNSNSALQNHKLILQVILENNMFPDVNDNTIFYIKTQPKTVAKDEGVYFLNILSKDGSIIITGMTKGPGYITGGQYASTLPDYKEIQYTGFARSVFKKSFVLMNDFAKKLGGKISYQ
ncbi:hypothetical protein [Pedobacter cryoconitis]|uniref:Uncharacterized protein n=1 Tax=Pedobacter cryoconitis TaxID=188932 RepID=A0A7X0MGP2_9SPHI|nr:hypothetical protein [Pedobacter cryoconitis]MBB6498512.1 hypothetical protein [Pedobacter cryoconitis]